MIAGMLHEAGLFLGSELDPVVREDTEIAGLLGTDKLAALIARRNGAHAVWGFKRPNLHVFGPGVVQAFRNPRVVVTSRDPLVVGRRDVLSEHRRDEFASIHAAAAETAALLTFAQNLRCPVLLVSYEKAVRDPARLARALLAFCGLQAEVERVAAAVEPESAAYRQSTERRYRGHIDEVRDGMVRGWAADLGSAEPLQLELLVSGRAAASALADEFRVDLAEQGIGSGCHGFSLPLPASTMPDASIAVRIAGRTYELVGSGGQMAQLAA